MDHAVQVRNLQKKYRDLVAVDDLSFEVERGEIFGMVGPNGAGKTTTVECLEGLRQPDYGETLVLGLDPHRDGYALRERIGVQLQDTELPPRLKVWEACDLFASFYRRSLPWEPLLDRLGLAQKRDASISKLSGGQKQRLYIVLALLNDPELVFLDELTTGLDPQARHAMWELVSAIRDQGKTVFLTTHFMEEAETLCDRVAILDRGKLVALDSPENLVGNLEQDRKILFLVRGSLDPKNIQCVEGVRSVSVHGGRVEVSGTGERLISKVVAALETSGCDFNDLHTRQPNLEDVFLTLTGSEIRN